ncbi:hypothetical protein BOCO_1055 [Bombiscardovia coagulans]|uniref:Uncharacterized protein n=1 Tax=Bombiscardovia coagulans TaxID=686666 RepID=A0A261ERE6_9BIFI|nr:hypothetical protein BOCO_1055 [Bombiscardovia coagulans]
MVGGEEIKTLQARQFYTTDREYGERVAIASGLSMDGIYA